jgi:hypothetical protein
MFIGLLMTRVRGSFGLLRSKKRPDQPFNLPNLNSACSRRDQFTQVELPPSEPPAPDAERR